MYGKQFVVVNEFFENSHDLSFLFFHPNYFPFQANIPFNEHSNSIKTNHKMFSYIFSLRDE